MAEGPGTAKRPKRERSYQTEWKKLWTASRRGPNFAHCDYCGTDVSIGHGGVNDVKKHLATTKHQEMVAQSPIEEAVT